MTKVGAGDLSIHGNRNLSTPHLDSIGSEGVIMDRFFVCPVCSPTRAEFLTGRYHPRGGVYSTSAGGERLNLGTTTIAEAFLEAGYKTGMFGKWHNGTQPPYHPRSRGFETFYGFTSGHWGHYFSPLLESNDQIVPGSGYINDDVTEHAMTFIKDHQERPFFCYLAFNTPHSPMQVPGYLLVPIRRQGASHAPPRPRKGKSGSHKGGTGHVRKYRLECWTSTQAA